LVAPIPGKETALEKVVFGALAGLSATAAAMRHLAVSLNELERAAGEVFAGGGAEDAPMRRTFS